MKNNPSPQIIALYLPQFHPTLENDEWWGKGFTEWTNTGKAKSLFWGHEQPKVPADLGYYDLRIEDVRIEQARLAKEAGIDAFCYWHYWFGNGKRLLEMPFNEVLNSKKPDFPFCLGWANHSWEKKTWQEGKKNKLLIEQLYLGKSDYINHFNTLLPAFKDSRYMLVNNKPFFLIWAPEDIPDIKDFIELWNELAIENGFDGMYFTAYTQYQSSLNKFVTDGFDSISVDLMNECSRNRPILKKLLFRFLRSAISLPRIISYDAYLSYFLKTFRIDNRILPVILPNYDHTPRSGKLGLVLHNSSPKQFGVFLRKLIKSLESKDSNNNIIIIKAWNEWGEGNYLEPDLKYGKEYLDEIKRSKNAN
jgi:lipopolysaccharide biosynthesis protein